ncbi:MAG: NAD(P) transhydrogenase subunit alpha [Chitinophagaceae bacterium]|jgi:NAD(P) transhydrogenase subunit alpha
MIVGVLKEQSPETRVSLIAEGAAQLTKKNITVWIEKGAGETAYCSDDAYVSVGAQIKTAEEIAQQADVVLSIHAPNIPLRKDMVLIGMYQARFQTERIQSWCNQGAVVYSMDLLPRTTRAQSMDILSSQANIAGYKAVLVAANHYGRYFPMFMTAAGSIAPAKVLILGAGVAGLQAIATAKRLGSVVEVFDTRPAVKEEVQSLGAKFIEIPGAADASSAGGYAVEQSEEYKRNQQLKIAESIAKSDIVITTAQIPGKKAPILVTEEMLKSMRKGSVIVDLAASTGGNTPFTKDREVVEVFGVKIVGDSNLPATLPSDASKLYGKNILNFLQLITSKEGNLITDSQDELVIGSRAKA